SADAHEALRHRVVTRAKADEIDPWAATRVVPIERVNPRRLSAVEESSHEPSLNVEHADTHQRRLRKGVRDARPARTGIWRKPRREGESATLRRLRDVHGPGRAIDAPV